MIYNDSFLPWLNEQTGKAYFNGSKTEIITFCPWCEGDHLHKKHGHLYIGTKEPVFYCQKCGEKGIIAKLILHYNGVVNDHVSPEVLSMGNYSYTRKEFSGSEASYNLEECVSPENINYNMKEDYLCKRIGREIDVRKVPGLVLSIKSFLRENKLMDKIPSWHLNFLDDLETNFVGFLSTKKTTIILRNCSEGNEKLRYYKFSLDTLNPFFLDFYGIKTGTPDERVPNIVICEGVFDLLVPIFNKTDIDFLKKDTLAWGSSLGKGSFHKTLLAIIDYYKVVKANVHVLSDSDVPWFFYLKMNDLPYINRLTIYWNTRGKDFGELPYNLTKKEMQPRFRRSNYAKSSNSQNRKNLYGNKDQWKRN